ncbi:MAG: TonB-dependent receptor [Asticcacaulis sp.]|nr:TonB-dependent receptor [Asticcacaulis sp.]
MPWFYQSNLSAHKAAEIRGFEMGGRTFFDFLPSPFDGFGVSGSVTYVDSRNPAVLANSVVGPYVPDNSGKSTNNGPLAGNPNTDFGTMPYFGMAKWSYNVELYYSKKAFSTRVAYNWHDKQLLSTNANPTSYNATGGQPYVCTACLGNGVGGQIWEMVPLWSDAAGYLDWSADYRVNDRISFGVSANNLTKTVSKTLQEPIPGVFERLDTYMADQRINVWLRLHY